MVDERKAPEGYKVTEVGIMPDDWEVKKLGEVLNNPKLGGNYSNSTSITQYPLIKMGNISRGSILVDKIEFIEEGIKPSKLHRLKYGNVLFNTRNTLDLVGKVGIWKDELPEAYYNSNLLLLDFHKSFVASTFFMNYVLNIKSSIVQLRNVATGTTSVAAIYSRDLYKILVPLPPKPEQKSIAEALSNTDSLIQSIEKLIDKKRKIKQGAMQQLLTEKKRLPGFSGEWCIKKLGDFFEITSSKRVFQSEWMSSGVPFYRARELAVLSERDKVDNELFISEQMYKEYAQKYGAPNENDILITGVGTLGKLYIVEHSDKFYFKDGNIIWLKSNGTIESRYIKHIFNTPFIINQIVNSSSGTTVGTYTITNAKNTEIFIPCEIEEQKAIAQVLSDMDAEIEALEEQLEKYKTIKQGMMQELLTGRIRLI